MMSNANQTLNSAKKPVHKKNIVVRQTLTSKLRAERGDKLQFIKNEMKKIDEKLSLLKSASKDNTNTFKKPSVISDSFKISNNKTVTPMNNNVMKQTGTTTNRFIKCDNKSLIKNKPAEKPKTSVNISTKYTPNKTDLQADKNKSKPLTSSRNVRTNLVNQFNGKFSLLPNEIKNTLPKQDIKSKRASFMPVNKKEVIRKTALKSTNSETNTVKKTVTVQSPIRKSLSAMHFKRVRNCDRNTTIHRTVSWSDNLSPMKSNTKKINIQTTPYMNHNSNSIQRTISWSDGLNPDGEKLIYKSPNKIETISFHTPSVAQRRSIICNTPMSIGNKTITPYSVISSPTTSDLKRRLHLWLEKKGKPLDSFHHLRCFSIQENVDIDEENKENFEIYIPDKNSSYENLKINNIETEKQEEDLAKNVLVANDAMYDLHKLILEGYPREQCEAWLDIICSKFQEVQDRPQYWECRAALEEVRGNYQRALDCYSNAIAKGAEVEKVNEPLDNLLEKFSVLNISQIESSKKCEKRNKAVLDARNVFKSSIINFAIQERKKIDEDGFKFTATPVRRSTRMSRLHYVTTPNTKICSTLDELDTSVKNSLHFQTNRGFKH